MLPRNGYVDTDDDVNNVDHDVDVDTDDVNINDVQYHVDAVDNDNVLMFVI